MYMNEWGEPSLGISPYAPDFYLQHLHSQQTSTQDHTITTPPHNKTPTQTLSPPQSRYSYPVTPKQQQQQQQQQQPSGQQNFKSPAVNISANSGMSGSMGRSNRHNSSGSYNKMIGNPNTPGSSGKPFKHAQPSTPGSSKFNAGFTTNTQHTYSQQTYRTPPRITTQQTTPTSGSSLTSMPRNIPTLPKAMQLLGPNTPHFPYLGTSVGEQTPKFPLMKPEYPQQQGLISEGSSMNPLATPFTLGKSIQESPPSIQTSNQATSSLSLSLATASEKNAAMENVDANVNISNRRGLFIGVSRDSVPPSRHNSSPLLPLPLEGKDPR
eukprot:TRINITY_DN3924_c0_g1_i1.p1 TRINITY_DN3924_c0_g1~~TRINITY_DN3924_c0_g1_i1.p1  ORF type:complete len:369 (+),score=72.81 TRINITY_DN3924_c0_g1_i1:136-1107(+)